MVNILLLTSIHERFGGYYRCLNLGKQLVRRGFCVTMICASGKNFDLLVRKNKIGNNFTIITLPRIKYSKYFSGQILRMFIGCFQVLFYRYDILHAFTVALPQVGVPAWVAKKLRGKKVIVDWEDLWGGGFAEYHPFPVKQVITFFEKTIPFAADCITVVSNFLWDRAVELGLDQKKMFLIPNGSDIEKIKPLDRNDSRRFLNFRLEGKIVMAVGNTYLNCLGMLFESFKFVLEKMPDAVLVMVGKVDIPEKFQDIYNKISHSVLLTGEKPFEEIPIYLGAADILVLPMDNDPIEEARFPMRFGDYLASGRPIVSNAVGAVKFYLEKYDCGIVSDPNDAKAMAENILFLFSNNKLAESIGVKARNLAENDLSWDKIADDLDNVYREGA